MKNPIIIQLIIVGLRDDPIPKEYPMSCEEEYTTDIQRFYRFFISQKLIKQEDLQNIELEIYDIELQVYRNVRDFIAEDGLRLVFKGLGIKKELLLYFKTRVSYNEMVQIAQTLQSYEQDKEQFLQHLQTIHKEIDLLKTRLPQLKVNNALSSNHIDIAILYSNPIMCQKNSDRQNPVPSIGYANEINRIRDIIHSTRLELKYRVIQATQDNLYSVLCQKPKILHIISHGEYDNKRAEVYLAFEKNGFMAPIYSEELCRLLTQTNSENPVLVILSCCHSGEIAKKIQIASINSTSQRFVVAVASEYKIEDKASQLYTSSLYQKLVQGQSIEQGHLSAQQVVKQEQGVNAYTCCCAHKHIQNCPFDNLRINNPFGYEEFHEKHAPTCNCNFKKEGLHIWLFDNQCPWASNYIEFLFEVQFQKFPDKCLMLLQNATVTRRVGNNEKQYLKVCCCELKSILDEIQKVQMEHDESRKFQIYTKSETNMKIFDQDDQGTPQEISPLRLYNINIVGRSFQMIKIWNHIVDQSYQQAFVIQGPTGSGKTALVTQTLWYLLERERIQCISKNDLDIIDLQQITSECQLFDRIKQANQFQGDIYSELNERQLKNQGKRIALVFENCDTLVMEKFFINFIKGLLHIHINVILTCTNEMHPNTFFQIERINTLDDKYAFELLTSKLTNPNNLINQNDYQELKNHIPLYPQNIIEFAEFHNRGNQQFQRTLSSYLKVNNH